MAYAFTLSLAFPAEDVVKNQPPAAVVGGVDRDEPVGHHQVDEKKPTVVPVDQKAADDRQDVAEGQEIVYVPVPAAAGDVDSDQTKSDLATANTFWGGWGRGWGGGYYYPSYGWRRGYGGWGGYGGYYGGGGYGRGWGYRYWG